MAAKPDEAATKERIIKHLNNDHQDSLVLYLEHYANLSSFSARNATITDVSLSGLSVSASGATHTIPFPQGALSSYSELRPAVVAMDQQCRAALNRSPITVKEFVAPTGVGLAFALWAFYNLITTTNSDNFLPGSWLYDNLYVHVPWFADLTYALAPWVWWGIIGGHGVEVFAMLIPRLRKHNVPLGSGLWFKWVGFEFFFDGFGTISRFDKLVAKKQAQRDAKAH